MNKQTKKTVAKSVKNALDMVLRTEANTASCAIMYQIKSFMCMHWIVQSC